MGKRSEFDRVEKDFYRTFDPRAIEPIKPFIEGLKYVEPCYGEGDLVANIGDIAKCIRYSDLSDGIDALLLKEDYFIGADAIITNPPWTRKVLHPMILHFCKFKPTWLLFDADWPHTKQSSELMKYCTDIVAIGQLTWIEGTKTTGKDNCAWYRFDINNNQLPNFHGRQTLDQCQTTKYAKGVTER